MCLLPMESSNTPIHPPHFCFSWYCRSTAKNEKWLLDWGHKLDCFASLKKCNQKLCRNYKKISTTKKLFRNGYFYSTVLKSPFLPVMWGMFRPGKMSVVVWWPHTFLRASKESAQFFFYFWMQNRKNKHFFIIIFEQFGKIRHNFMFFLMAF